MIRKQTKRYLNRSLAHYVMTSPSKGWITKSTTLNSLVNANDSANVINITSPEDFQMATPGDGALFDPLAANPFIGDWTFSPLASGSIQI